MAIIVCIDCNLTLFATSGLQSKDAEELQKQTEETKPPHVESPKSTDNVNVFLLTKKQQQQQTMKFCSDRKYPYQKP